MSALTRHPHANPARLIRDLRCYRCGEKRDRKRGYAQVESMRSHKLKAFVHLKCGAKTEELPEWLKFMSAELEAIP